MVLKTNRFGIVSIVNACILLGIILFFPVPAIADDHGEHYRHFEREDQHRLGFMESDNKGNETAGQITALLIVLACFPIAVSIMIRWINRFSPLDSGIKKTLVSLNRFQKKHLMRFHYYLGPVIAGVALWHWLASRCKSTSLPEWGLLIMVLLIGLGVFVKCKIGPRSIRKIVYKIHTQPFIFITLILILTIGHMIVD